MVPSAGVSATGTTDPPVSAPNAGRRWIIPALAALDLAIFAAIALGGDWREAAPLYLALTAVPILTMWAARRQCRSRRDLRVALVAALLFRLVAACGAPALSDDVYRYVWDGRVQRAGVHPYAHAPADPELAGLRDAGWERINHPELRTIYPPGAQALFGLLAAAGLSTTGFRVVLGLADLGVALALVALLRATGRPPARALWYAWNPLAVVESAGSGHLEPVGVLALVLALLALHRRRRAVGGLLLAAAVHVKLLPLLLVPAWLRALRARGLGAALAGAVALALPYALAGPAVGAGLFAYARRWEANAFLFDGVLAAWAALDPAPALKEALAALQRSGLADALPYETLYGLVWPGELARLTVALVAAGVAVLAWARRASPERAALAVLGAVLLLAPTVHPWYALWALAPAALLASPAWLLFAALVPLAYLGGGESVPLWARCVEYLPVLALLAWPAATRRLRRALEPRVDALGCAPMETQR